MAEPEKQQIGDGSDNYGQAAGQMAKAAKQAGQEAAKQTAAKGAEAKGQCGRRKGRGRNRSRNRCGRPLGRYPVCSMGNAPYSFQDTGMYLSVSVIPDYHDCFPADNYIK